MSFLPPDILPGEPYLLGMVTSAGPTQPFFAPASGGGGGGGGPNLVCSTLTTNGGFEAGGGADIVPGGPTFAIGSSTLQGYAVYGSTLSQINYEGGQLQRVAWSSGLTQPDNNDMSLNISTSQSYFNNLVPTGTFLEIQSDSANTFNGSLELGALPDGRAYVGAALGGSQSTLSTLCLIADGVNISSLNVSSINGQAPGGGSSAFTSSFLLTIPGGTSSLVMALPAGQYAFMGTALYTGSNNFLSGTASALLNVTSGQWSANVIENPNTGNRPADTGSGCSMILNTWENPLSTAKLYINNVNASPAGDATWAGVVGKLY